MDQSVCCFGRGFLPNKLNAMAIRRNLLLACFIASVLSCVVDGVEINYPVYPHPAYPAPNFDHTPYDYTAHPYNHRYEVKDGSYYKANYRHRETDDGVGSYRVALPDGQIVLVTYNANDDYDAYYVPNYPPVKTNYPHYDQPRPQPVRNTYHAEPFYNQPAFNYYPSSAYESARTLHYYNHYQPEFRRPHF